MPSPLPKPDLPKHSIQTGHFYYLSAAPDPVLEIQSVSAPGRRAQPLRLPFTYVRPGRHPGEALWVTRLPESLPGPVWAFRIRLGAGCFEGPSPDRYYRTSLHTVWLQDRQLFDYQPAPVVSPSQVRKISRFSGQLSPRDLYVYTPRGYTEHRGRHYPVIYMHDGQNVFETYAEDSFVGTWRADETADQLIAMGRMQECLIVGVSHGGANRRLEYTPPYIARQAETLISPATRSKRTSGRQDASQATRLLQGQADQTLAYYREDVTPYVRKHFRVLAERDNTAVCGSSMGGIFSLYIAWEAPEFARHYAALSPAFVMTTDHRTGTGVLAHVEARTRPDIRLWLDSGTQDSPGKGDDDQDETRAARDAFLKMGFEEGKNFRYLLDEGASHHESSWSRRLPEIFAFLLPPGGK